MIKNAGCKTPPNFSGTLLTIGEVAARFNVSTRTVSRWISQRRIRVFKPSKRSIRISEADIADFHSRNSKF